jgi:hypothetical protein
MTQRIKDEEEKETVPQTKQQEEETIEGIVIKKEQQGKASVDDVEEGVSKIEDKPPAATIEKQRGKYRQYEEGQFIIEKIRSYRTQRYPDSEIMKLLDNMPRRTYYNYVKKLQEQDRQVMEQWMSENVEHFSEEVMIYRETSCQKLRELQGIIDNKSTPPKDKMEAIKQYQEQSENLFHKEWEVRCHEVCKTFR